MIAQALVIWVSLKPSSELLGDFGGHIWAVLCTRMYVLVPLAS